MQPRVRHLEHSPPLHLSHLRLHDRQLVHRADGQVTPVPPGPASPSASTRPPARTWQPRPSNPRTVVSRSFLPLSWPAFHRDGPSAATGEPLRHMICLAFHMRSRARTSGEPFAPINCRLLPIVLASVASGGSVLRLCEPCFHMNYLPFHRKWPPLVLRSDPLHMDREEIHMESPIYSVPGS